MEDLQQMINGGVDESANTTYYVVATDDDEIEININITLENPKDQKKFEKWLDKLFYKGFVAAWTNEE